MLLENGSVRKLVKRRSRELRDVACEFESHPSHLPLAVRSSNATDGWHDRENGLRNEDHSPSCTNAKGTKSNSCH